VHDNENPTVSLSEEESTVFQRMLRASRRDVENVEFGDGGVHIKIFAYPLITVDYTEALEMDDAAWGRLFAKYPPLI